MKKRINVTARDAKLGDRYDPSKCPVARAMTRAFREDIRVGYGCVWRRGSEHVVCYLPQGVAHALRRFDRTGKIEPFSFVVEMEVKRGVRTRKENP